MTMLSLLFLAVACGGSSSEKTINSIPWSFQDQIKESTPKVEVDSLLSEGMGMLLVKKYNSIGLCTSFMISEDHLMTNSHCVSDVSLIENCSESIGVHIQTRSSTEYRTCKKI